MYQETRFTDFFCSEGRFDIDALEYLNQLDVNVTIVSRKEWDMVRANYVKLGNPLNIFDKHFAFGVEKTLDGDFIIVVRNSYEEFEDMGFGGNYGHAEIGIVCLNNDRVVIGTY